MPYLKVDHHILKFSKESQLLYVKLDECVLTVLIPRNQLQLRLFKMTLTGYDS